MGLSNWKPSETHVQGGLSDGQFMSGAYVLVAAGPPRLSNLGGATAAGLSISSGEGANELAYPIGTTQDFNLSHNRAHQKIFEIGSERSYSITGRAAGQFVMSKVMYHGPSLLRLLYAYYQDLQLPTVVLPVFANIGLGLMSNPHDVKIPPGYENIFLNLASDLFAQPVGLLLYFKDSNEDTVGAAYLEACYVPSHTMATDATSTIIQESAAIQFERLWPVAVAGLGLITGGLGEILT